jgi:uncharacterized membrane protein YtjA (UPF0391 family)
LGFNISCDRAGRGCSLLGGIAGAAAGIAHIIFYVFLMLLLISLIMHFARGAAL